MSRANRGAALLLTALLFAAPALADELIADRLIAPRTANYQTATVERRAFEKTQTAPGRLVYPSATLVQYRGERAKFVKYTIKRGAEVQEGDVLAYLTLDASEAELEELTLRLTRAQSDYRTGRAERLLA
ncbi:MAG: hypothetical protein GX558_03160, partial [Clostridiales bacterium]|nr:hypothetical protein [Clostridiales bacterium]